MKLMTSLVALSAIVTVSMANASPTAFSLSSSGYTQAASGDIFCKNQAPGQVTCFPTINQSTQEIHVWYVNIGDKTLETSKWLLWSGPVASDPIMVMVLDKNEKLVWNDKIDNKVGLKCENDDESVRCCPWKDAKPCPPPPPS
ncbi:MAG: hypothetical protein COB66_06340 [Coxiella sp. (in: Bacteria)]|nr:MAG: hypothetical protein COB66_06340 [Coxiella sp. (in: g-proteobacteria)]